MAELVDAPASGAGARKGVEVRVLFWAPFSSDILFPDREKLIEQRLRKPRYFPIGKYCLEYRCD
jgi:hypothetical protein